MSLKPQAICPVPPETVRVARAAYPKGNIYLHLRDTLGRISTDEDFADLYPKDGQPAEAPWRLALVSVMQFLENLSNRQAANAVRGRLDWKYLLGLELDDPGFDHSVLAEFRYRLVAGNEELRIFHLLLARLKEGGYVKARGRQRSDSTHVLAKIRRLNRIEGVGETFRATLNVLAIAAPEWLAGQLQEGWVDRYEHQVEDYRLPDGKQAREAYVLVIGKDGSDLLNAIYSSSTPSWIRELPAVQTLRRVWVHHFFWENGEVHWRETANMPAAGDCLDSPYDPEAHYANKCETSWVGYKVHLTETCGEETPHLITHVETTPAPASDLAALPHIHEALQQHDLLPERHIVDTGYVDAEAVVKSQQDYEIDLFGPTRDDYRWQARESTGFAASQFVVDWQQERATCPAGKTSSSWTQAQDRRGSPVITIKFAVQDCGPCPHRQGCTHTQATSPRRTLTVRPQARYQALQAGRQRQATEEFKAQYNRRAGIEGTLSQGIRAFGLRQARYRGQAKVHLQHALIATALNLSRLFAWLIGQSRAKTRQPAFMRLVKQRV